MINLYKILSDIGFVLDSNTEYPYSFYKYQKYKYYDGFKRYDLSEIHERGFYSILGSNTEEEFIFKLKIKFKFELRKNKIRII